MNGCGAWLNNYAPWIYDWWWYHSCLFRPSFGNLSVELKGEAEGTARSQNQTLEKRDRRQQGHEGWRGGAARWRCAVKQSPSVHDRRLGVWTNKLNSKGVKGSLDNPVIVFDGMACPKLNERMKRLLLWAVVILHSEGYSSPIGCSQIMLLYYVSCRSLALHIHLDSNIGRLWLSLSFGMLVGGRFQDEAQDG